MIWPSVLVHMRALGEALKMQKSLKAARARQIEEARLKLEQHSGSRELVVQGATKEVADPTHDPSICFSAPTLRCLIEEALETIKGSIGSGIATGPCKISLEFKRKRGSSI